MWYGNIFFYACLPRCSCIVFYNGHSGGVCAVLVFDLLPPPPPRDISCCVLCCACTCAKVCVGGKGGAHMPKHAPSVLVFISVCLSPLHPTPTFVSLRWDTCMNVFVLVVF